MKEQLLAELVAALVFVVFVITEVLILTIATFLALKALLLERRSNIGRALSRNNLAMSLAYYSAFFGLWIPLLRHPIVRGGVVVVTFATALSAIREFVRVYGGWRATLAEAAEALAELIVELRSWLRRIVSKGVSIILAISHGYAKIGIVLVVLALLVVLVLFVVLGEI